MIKRILILIVLLTLFSCKKQNGNINILNNRIYTVSTITIKTECNLPQEIKSYIGSNTDFELLTIKDLKLLGKYVNISLCSIYTRGDFNHNGKEDIAIILRYKGYKNEEYPNYIFPFLVIFNDYKDGVTPTIVFKTGHYSDESEKSVIYDQFEEGIFSYIENDKVFNNEVVKVVLPEKSTFYVYWNSNKSVYEFINSLDEDFYKKIKGSNSYGKEIIKIKDNNLGSLSDNFSIKGRWITRYAKENLPKEIRYNNDKGTFFMRDSEIIIFDNNTGIFFMKDSKGGYIAKILVEYNIKTKSIEYLEATIIDTKYKYFDWNIDIKPNTPIAVIKKGDNKKIYLEWKGLYNSKTKKIEFSQNPFNQATNTFILYNCDY
ncbi:hypothetical protein [Flavobacterium foetidum]|uniref:hypothetical protein n=1 Tax=Flavobacterium foetidum TaxID=2026681 RepID=UPI001074FC96|nr:hypothetical protein [Flavobacterium foetidum]KAF2517738.1 hypothetical protein E0W73_00600 [Flavobacterium foetidum]